MADESVATQQRVAELAELKARVGHGGASRRGAEYILNVLDRRTMAVPAPHFRAGMVVASSGGWSGSSRPGPLTKLRPQVPKRSPSPLRGLRVTCYHRVPSCGYCREFEAETTGSIVRYSTGHLFIDRRGTCEVVLSGAVRILSLR